MTEQSFRFEHEAVDRVMNSIHVSVFKTIIIQKYTWIKAANIQNSMLFIEEMAHSMVYI